MLSVRSPHVPGMEPARPRARRRPLAGLVLILLAFASGPAWARRQRSIFSTPVVDWSPLTDEDNKPPALTFRPAWTWSGFPAPLSGPPVACAGRIVVASRDGEMAALDPLTGKPDWTVKIDEPLAVGPATDGTRVFVASTGSRLRAFDGRDGGLVWTTDLTAAPVVAPRVIGSRVLVGTADGALLSVETEGGRIAAIALLPGRISAIPEPAPGSILAGTDHGAVLSFDADTLELRYRRDVGAAVTSPAVYDDGRVFFATADRRMYCLRFRSGRVRWVTRVGARCTARALPIGPYLYVLCYDNDIYVFTRRDGHQMTRVRLGHRLDADATVAQDHLLVVPFTEASVIGLTLPRLQNVGRFALQAPGEWFTTPALRIGDLVAVGYGKSAGRIVALQMTEEKTPPEGAPKTGAGSPAPAPKPSPAP